MTEPSKKDPDSIGSRTKKEAVGFLKDDLLGAADWKASKLGSISGLTPAFRAVSSVFRTAGDGTRHIAYLAERVASTDDVEPLGEDFVGRPPEERFRAAMSLHGKTEKDIEISKRNTFFASYLYLALAIVNIIISISLSLIHPPLGLVDLAIRFGPLPLLLAFFIKNSYTNYIFRRRSLLHIGHYFKDFAFLPKK